MLDIFDKQETSRTNFVSLQYSLNLNPLHMYIWPNVKTLLAFTLSFPIPKDVHGKQITYSYYFYAIYARYF